MKRDGVIRVLNLGSVSNLETQAVYHAVAAGMREQSVDTIVICWPTTPYVCIGYHQNARIVLNLPALSELSLPAMRRRLGGGTTYLDSSQLFYQCIFHRSRVPAAPAAAYKMQLRSPINVLRQLGVDAELRYVNEIEVDGRRIAGIGGGYISEASVVVGNYLLDFPHEVMAKLINVPCERFRDCALAAMKDRITTLKQENYTESWSELPQLLCNEFGRVLERSVHFDELTEVEREKSEELAELMTSSKYLEQHEVAGSPRFITRLKIAASTFVELLQVHSDNYIRYAVVVIKNGVIDEFHAVDKNFDDQGLSAVLRKVNQSDIVIGEKFD